MESHSTWSWFIRHLLHHSHQFLISTTVRWMLNSTQPNACTFIGTPRLTHHQGPIIWQCYSCRSSSNHMMKFQPCTITHTVMSCIRIKYNCRSLIFNGEHKICNLDKFRKSYSCPDEVLGNNVNMIHTHLRSSENWWLSMFHCHLAYPISHPTAATRCSEMRFLIRAMTLGSFGDR